MSRSKGFTLLHVLVLLMILSMILLAETRFTKPRQLYSSLSLTVAQTQMLLNDSFAFFSYSGHWDNAGSDCKFLQGSATNGFGQPAFCYFPDSTSSDLGARIGVVQWIPSDLGVLYKSNFGSSDVEDYGSLTSPSGYAPPSGYMGIVVYTNNYGGSQQKIDTFSLLNYSTSKIPKLQCGTHSATSGSTSTLSYFSAMSGMCAHLYATKSLDASVVHTKDHHHYTTCNSSQYPDDDMYNYMHYLGFEFLLADFPSDSDFLVPSYNFYRKPIYHHYWNWTHTLETHPPGPKCDNSYYYTTVPAKEDGDGMINADASCNGENLNAAIFQMCKN